MTHMTALERPPGEMHPDRAELERATRGEPARTRNTPRKRALLEVLRAADGFLSTAELHDRLRAHLASQGLRVGITTVYNQLRALADAGRVDTLQGDDGETRYWLPRDHNHHHYLVCRSCRRALEVVADPVEQWADTLGETLGFRDVTHNFELFGLCDRCASHSSADTQIDAVCDGPREATNRVPVPARRKR